MQPFGIAAPIAATGEQPPRQAEYTAAGVYDVVMLDDVTEITGAVLIGAGAGGVSVSPFNGGSGGGNHWRNRLPTVPRREYVLTLQAAKSPDVAGGLAGQSHLKDGGGTTLLFVDGATSGYPTYGGGGGDGGPASVGSSGNGGLGSGAGGYMGAGGRGGNNNDTTSGQMPAANSGGGRGGDRNGVPNGYTGDIGEGCGLLGRTPTFDPGSAGTPKFGGGGTPVSGAGLTSGARLMFGGPRSYPDRASDLAATTPASLVNSGSGTNVTTSFSPPVHTDARPGDLVVVYATGGISVTVPNARWKVAGGLYWKQLTAADIAASAAGTLTFTVNGTFSWISAVYRGAMVARSVSQIGSAADTVNIPGFTKRVDCRRIIAITADADLTATMAAPSGFTSRGFVTGSNVRMRLCDAAPSAYINGASVTYTGMVATKATNAYLIELH